VALSSRALASLGLLALGAGIVATRGASPSIATGPMMLTMLMVPILLPLRMPWQALAAFVIAATYLVAADCSHAGLAEEAATLAAAISGILLSVVAAVCSETRATTAAVDGQ
jgi:hypothetical protein